MDLLVIRADGRAAVGAVVGVTAAPASAVVQDIGLVADAAGRVRLDAAVAGDWVFAVWHDGRAATVALRLDGSPGPHALRLPA